MESLTIMYSDMFDDHLEDKTLLWEKHGEVKHIMKTKCNTGGVCVCEREERD